MIHHTGIIHTTLFPSLIWRMPGKKIFLTFDDGPHPAATSSVLDLLSEHHVRATFFISGMNIHGNEALIKRISHEGHSLGIHAFHHTRLLAFSKEKTKREILQTNGMIKNITGHDTRLFRPPFGFFSWNTIAAARELNYLLVMWSCLTGDFSGASNSTVVNTSLKNLSHGSILVFHDNDLTANRITDILHRVIPEIKKRGFEFGAIR